MARKKKPAPRKVRRRSAAGKRAPRASVTPVFEAFAIGLAAETLATQRVLARKISRETFSGGSDIEFLRRGRSEARTARDIVATPRGATLTVGAAWERARELASMKGVRYAEPLFRGPGLEPDPRHARKLLAPHERAALPRRAKGIGGDKPLPCAQNVLWSLEQIRAPEAWALTPPQGGVQFGEGIVIGHPDTGYRPHEEIWSANPAQRRVRPGDGYDFEDRDADPLDPLRRDGRGHGTATASVIMSARAAAHEKTVVGVAPSAELVPIRVSDGVVHFSFKNVTQAIYHAVDRAGAHVISMSLGGPFYSKALEEAVDHAIDEGVIVLAAAGNVWPSVVYPARLDQVIAVAACNCNVRPWSKSARGAAVDITAPGESVWRAKSKKNHNGTVLHTIEPSSGTSYAVANVAGACATWLAFHGRATLLSKYGPARVAGVFRALLVTAGHSKPTSWKTKQFGAGIIDVEKLLRAPLPPASKMAKKTLFPVRSRQEGTVERIAGYFPDLALHQVRSVLGAWFAPGVRGPARRRMLEQLGPELTFHVASNAELRARLYARAKAPRPKQKARVGNPLAPAKQRASPTLRRALEA